MFVLGGAVVLIEGLHLFALGATRAHAREMLRQTLDNVTAVDARTIAATLNAFDRMTHDIFLAATGPYILFAICIPPVLVSLARLHSMVRDTERTLEELLRNGEAKENGFIGKSLVAEDAAVPQNSD